MVDRDAEEIASKTFLSERQAEILLLKQQGLTHQEIADHLGVEKGSIDSQSSRINSKQDKARRTMKEVREPNLHDRDTLSDGTPIGRQGGTWRMLDETNRPTGDHFHKIVLASDGYYGKLGATWNKIDRNGEVLVADVRPPEEPLTDGGETLEFVKRQYAAGNIDKEELDRCLDHVLSEDSY